MITASRLSEGFTSLVKEVGLELVAVIFFTRVRWNSFVLIFASSAREFLTILNFSRENYRIRTSVSFFKNSDMGP